MLYEIYKLRIVFCVTTFHCLCAKQRIGEEKETRRFLPVLLSIYKNLMVWMSEMKKKKYQTDVMQKVVPAGWCNITAKRMREKMFVLEMGSGSREYHRPSIEKKKIYWLSDSIRQTMQCDAWCVNAVQRTVLGNTSINNSTHVIRAIWESSNSRNVCWLRLYIRIWYRWMVAVHGNSFLPVNFGYRE